MIVNSAKPFNAEPPPELLIDAGLTTPNDLHYVRNHLPVPIVDPANFKLTVQIEGGKSLEFTLDQLKNEKLFPRHTVLTTLQCAGNRCGFHV